MRFFIIGLAFTAMSSFTIATSDHAESGDSFESLCQGEDGPCQDLKQAAAAVGNTLGQNSEQFADPTTISCYAKGAPCNVAKREALAMAEAVAEAYAMAFPDETRKPSETALQARDAQDTTPAVEARWYQWCFRRGAACAKKREATPDLSQWCKEIGGHCTEEADKVIQAADVVARAMDPEKRWYQWCFRRGAACAKIKRATEYLAEFVNV